MDPLRAARTHLDIHARELEQAGRSPATVARRLSALASFYAYAVDEGALDGSPAARVRRPRVSEESPTLGLGQGELSAFLAGSEGLGGREHLLACLLALNGLRVSEACGADAGDVDTERGHRVLAVVRKRGKCARVPLAPRTIDALDRYLAGRTDGPLLLTDDYRRLDRHQARRIVRRIARTAGIEKRISPHSLRHSFVTLSLDAGVALRDVQDAAGHADPRTTRRYDRARESLERHPTYRLAAYVSESPTSHSP